MRTYVYRGEGGGSKNRSQGAYVLNGWSPIKFHIYNKVILIVNIVWYYSVYNVYTLKKKK